MCSIFVTFTSPAGQIRLRMPRSVVLVEIGDVADTSAAVLVQTRGPNERAVERVFFPTADNLIEQLLAFFRSGDAEVEPQ